MAQVKSGQERALLAHPGGTGRICQEQWQLASLNIALIAGATADVVFLKDPIITASGVCYVAFYLATAFFL